MSSSVYAKHFKEYGQSAHEQVWAIDASCFSTPENIALVGKNLAPLLGGKKNIILIVPPLMDAVLPFVHHFDLKSPQEEKNKAGLWTAAGNMGLHLLALFLEKEGIRTKTFCAWQIPFITDPCFLKANPLSLRGEGILQCLKDGQTPLIASSQGVTQGAEETFLGRQSVFSTAVMTAEAFEIKEILFFRPVDGFFCVDPALIPKTQRYKTLSYESLKHFDQYQTSLFPEKAVLQAEKMDIKTKVMSCLHTDGRGTLFEKGGFFQPGLMVHLVDMWALNDLTPDEIEAIYLLCQKHQIFVLDWKLIANSVHILTLHTDMAMMSSFLPGSLPQKKTMISLVGVTRKQKKFYTLASQMLYLGQEAGLLSLEKVFTQEGALNIITAPDRLQTSLQYLYNRMESYDFFQENEPLYSHG